MLIHVVCGTGINSYWRYVATDMIECVTGYWLCHWLDLLCAVCVAGPPHLPPACQLGSTEWESGGVLHADPDSRHRGRLPRGGELRSYVGGMVAWGYNFSYSQKKLWVSIILYLYRFDSTRVHVRISESVHGNLTINNSIIKKIWIYII